MNSFICWVGGKKLLRKKILEQFPDATEYERYIEVFGGAGWILFAKDKHAKFEVLNDINGNLVNLYRCVKYHCEELQRELDNMLISREQFFDYVEQINMRGLTDIQKAARFFLLIKLSFGGDVNNPSFGRKAIRISASVEYLQEVKKRLERVVIENRDFEKLIKSYNYPDAFFYLDPPYVEAEGYYKAGFGQEEHERLKKTVDGIKGKFLISYNDHPLVRELYKEYTIIPIERQHNMLTAAGGGRYKEVLIKNY